MGIVESICIFLKQTNSIFIDIFYIDNKIKITKNLNTVLDGDDKCMIFRRDILLLSPKVFFLSI